MEKAEQGGNCVNQVASDNGKEDIEEKEGKCEGADVVKNDSVENEMKDSVGVVLSTEECTVEGDDSSQLTARVDEEDQTCEPVNPTPEVEGDDLVVSPVPSSQEVEPGVGVVKGELEGGATSGMDSSNTAKTEIDREEIVRSRSGDSNLRGQSIEEQHEGIDSGRPDGADGEAEQPVSLQLACSSSASSVSSLSSSEYSFASD